MATKVKGDAIKEGSIPLSALSSEVQEKIENSGSKVFVFTYDMVKSENEDGSLTIDPANAIEMINSDFINMMDVYNMEKTHTYGDFAVFSFTLKLNPLTSQEAVMYVYSEGVIVIMSAVEEHPFVFDSDGGEDENKVRKRLSLLDLALGDSDRKDYTEYIDEVKENVKKNLGITDAVTPDWNAKEGEKGYIENKPFGISCIEDTHFGDNEWQTYEDIYLYVAKSSHNDIYMDDSDYIRLDDGMSHTFYLDGKCGGITVHNSSGFLSIISQDYFDTEEQAAEFLNNVLKVVTFKELDNAFIADTVVKTTPQNLEVEEMHQALANLGIDPVVWKYIMNPFVLQTGRIIPDELIASDGKSFKYSYAGMYNWAKGYAYDKDNFDYGNNDLEGFGSVHCPHNTMDYRDGNIYGAGNEIPPEGLPTSLSDMDDVEGPYGVFHDNWSSYFTTGAWCINKDTKQCYLSV